MYLGGVFHRDGAATAKLAPPSRSANPANDNLTIGVVVARDRVDRAMPDGGFLPSVGFATLSR